MKFPISSIRPNPFRHIERYPYREDKIAALRQSVHDTGFWDNVVARVTDDGAAEIAYGHHRLELLRRDFPPDFEVDLIVRDLDDTHMLKIMAAENMEEWGTSAAIEQETVRAVIEAYAEGKIRLDAPTPGKADLRVAPSFQKIGRQPPEAGAPIYTTATVGKFLGWMKKSKKTGEPSDEPQRRLDSALDALEFIEIGALVEAQFDGLTTTAAEVIVQQARRARADDEAKARRERQAAERARLQAEKAEVDRRRAETERQKREEQAARARSEQARRERERQAEQARHEAEEAERRRQQAEAERQKREKQAAEARSAGHQKAKQAGQRATHLAKTGTGWADVANKMATEEAKQRAKDPNTPPSDLEDIAKSVAKALNQVLDSKSRLANEIKLLLHFRNELSDHSQRDLLLELDHLINRVVAVRDALQPKVQSSHAPAMVIDGEPVEGEIVTTLPGNTLVLSSRERS